MGACCLHGNGKTRAAGESLLDSLETVRHRASTAGGRKAPCEASCLHGSGWEDGKESAQQPWTVSGRRPEQRARSLKGQRRRAAQPAETDCSAARLSGTRPEQWWQESTKRACCLHSSKQEGGGRASAQRPLTVRHRASTAGGRNAPY